MIRSTASIRRACRMLAPLGAVMVVLVATIATLVPAGAPAGAAPTFPPERPTRVLILGDSVLKGTVGQYGRRLAGRDVTVDAEISRTTAASADRLAQLGTDWDVVVVLLGYNDGGSARAFQPAATRILDQLAAVPRVVWLSLHEVRRGYQAVNHFIAGQLARRPNLRTADWNAVCNANPRALAGDGIHPRGSGAGLLADLVAAQVVQAEADRVAEALAAIAAMEAARQQAEAQALIEVADARQAAAFVAVLDAKQQAAAALAEQHQASLAWEQRQALVAAQRAEVRRRAAIASRRVQRIGLAVARSSEFDSPSDHRTEIGVAAGLAVLAVTGLGASVVVGNRRRRPAPARTRS